MRNREGTEVDPLPWVVVVSLGFMLVFSLGPIYLQGYGLALRPALGVCTLLFLGVVGVSYWRYVYTATPELRAEIDPEIRLERLFYAVIAGVLVLAAISLPLAVQ
ncbi:MAG: hypothetical protein ABEJ67_06570 [Halanaeroarchaeum sp.]